MGSFVPAARGAYRRRRPAVLARRRRRRPRARALDLHGRDGRDGRDPQPGEPRARSSSSTRSGAAPRPSTGLSIAWAAIEHLHEANRCRALFATHFHELTALAERLPRLANATLRVTEWNGDVVFLHEVVLGRGRPLLRPAGGAPRRPAAERHRPRQDDPRRARAGRPGAAEARPRRRPAALRRRPSRRDPPPEVDRLREALDAIDPDEMTPKQALEALYRLKAERLRRA